MIEFRDETFFIRLRQIRKPYYRLILDMDTIVLARVWVLRHYNRSENRNPAPEHHCGRPGNRPPNEAQRVLPLPRLTFRTIRDLPPQGIFEFGWLTLRQ